MTVQKLVDGKLTALRVNAKTMAALEAKGETSLEAISNYMAKAFSNNETDEDKSKAKHRRIFNRVGCLHCMDVGGMNYVIHMPNGPYQFWHWCQCQSDKPAYFKQAKIIDLVHLKLVEQACQIAVEGECKARFKGKTDKCRLFNCPVYDKAPF